MTDLRLYNRSFLRDFIHLYRDHPVLWDKNNEFYTNESSRFAAYADLQDKLLEVDKDATIETVRNKIGNMRSNFRYEMKKIESAMELGEEYRPKLWYFKELLFLTDKKIPKSVLENIPLIDYEEIDTTSIRLCNKEFVREFLNLYKQNECLWKIQSASYRNKRLKLKALESLRKLYSQCDKNITIDGIKKKINSFRACFRNELKKMREAEKKGETYKSVLYYFNDLMFLKVIDSKRYGFKEFEAFFNSNSSSESCDFKEFENINYENFLKQQPSTNSSENGIIEEFEIDDENHQEIDDDIIEEIPINNSNITIEICKSDNDDGDATEDLFQFENNDYELNSVESVSEDDKRNILQEQEQNITIDEEKNNSKEINENLEEMKIIESPKELRIDEKYDHIEKKSKNDSLQLYGKTEECNAYANYVISELKVLPADERIFVKKIFSDILFEAKLGNAKCIKLISNTAFQKQLNK